MSLSKYKLPISVFVGLVLAGTIGFAASYAIRSNDSSQASVAVSTQPRLGSKENPHEIALTESQKEPIDILINVGDYVQFNSKDGGEHQIIQGKPTVEHGHDTGVDAGHDETGAAEEGESHGVTTAPLDSGVFKADEGYSLQFKNVGKYEFHDNYNHEYAITVIVYDKDKKSEDTKIE